MNNSPPPDLDQISIPHVNVMKTICSKSKNDKTTEILIITFLFATIVERFN